MMLIYGLVVAFVSAFLVGWALGGLQFGLFGVAITGLTTGIVAMAYAINQMRHPPRGRQDRNPWS